MKRNYLGFWLILATAFAIFAILSTVEGLAIGSHELKSSNIARNLGLVKEKSPVVNVRGAARRATARPTTSVVKTDTCSKTILFIGDSMLDGLSPRLAHYAKQNGHKLYSVIWYSSTSEVWGRSDKLSSYIAKLKPDYIFICLGSNELNVPDIAAKRDKYVKKMLKDIGNIPYVWIGPPNWKRDTGINDLIASNVKPGCYFKSDGMKFVRKKDGAHPTHESAAVWMDSIARWMPKHCAHPIKMAVPKDKTGRATRVFIHSPSEK